MRFSLEEMVSRTHQLRRKFEEGHGSGCIEIEKKAYGNERKF